MVNQRWALADIPELKVGDCLAFEARGWKKLAVRIIGAKSFHWALAGEKLVDDRISVGDYSIVDSIAKGTTTHLLSEYRGRKMRVYRPKLPLGIQEARAPRLIKLYSYYGDQRYNWFGILIVAMWWLLRKADFKVEWWEHDGNSFYCLEFVDIVWRDLGYPLVPGDEPPYPTNMEQSPVLELIWSSF